MEWGSAGYSNFFVGVFLEKVLYFFYFLPLLILMLLLSNLINSTQKNEERKIAAEFRYSSFEHVYITVQLCSNLYLIYIIFLRDCY